MDLYQYGGIALFAIALFCLIHIIRDVCQIKYGYTNWFTKFGHVWHAPQYEKHGVVVFALIGTLFVYLGLR